MQDNTTNSSTDEIKPAVTEGVEETPTPELTVEAAGEVLAESENATPESQELAGEETSAENPGDAAARAVMAEVLRDIEHLENVIETSSPRELCVLLDAITHEKELRDLIPFTVRLKKLYDKLRDEGHPEIDTASFSRFTTLWARWNKRRAGYIAEVEHEKQDNSKKKYALLDRLKEIVETENMGAIQEVRDLQKQWREIGWVMQQDILPLSQTYKHLLDVYYNLRGQYNQLVDLDRKYNLEEKQKIIAGITALTPSPDREIPREEWNELAHKVKKLQEDWKTIGHVTRENADEINEAYRTAADGFFNLRSKFLEGEEKVRIENETAKKDLIEKIRAICEPGYSSPREWNEQTKVLAALQEEWKKLGPATYEENGKLWREYRSLCEKFFREKSAFFKKLDDERSRNLKLKTKICEEAESIMNSEEWDVTAKRLKELQSDWKNIGPVQDRFSQKIWKRFRDACNTFFDRKAAQARSGSPEENTNMKTKEELISRLAALQSETDVAILAPAYKEIQIRWKNTGHVPFREKERINNAYREANNAFHKHLELQGIDLTRLNMEMRLNLMNEEDRNRQIGGEMRRLQKSLRDVEDSINSYQTNILYISKGKSGDALRKQIQEKIDVAQAEIAKIRAQIKALRELEKNS